MDSYKRLKLEFNGIKDVIEEYSSSGNVSNFLKGLQQALDTNEIDNVLYYLEEICKWYQNNIREICSNEYVFNADEHLRNKDILSEINSDLKKYDFSARAIENNKSHITNSPKIFLSHRSSDKKYGDALEKLITGLGVKNDQLIYTSHPLHKIPLNENIYDYLRKNINQNVFVIILWSNEYLKSPACLNEMGAAWVTQSDYTNIYTPDFAFGNPLYHECAVDTRKMGAVLNGDDNCRTSMIEFKNKLLKMFNLSVDEKTSFFLLDQFMKDIK